MPQTLELTLELNTKTGEVDMRWGATIETPLTAELKMYITGALLFAHHVGGCYPAYQYLKKFKEAHTELLEAHSQKPLPLLATNRVAADARAAANCPIKIEELTTARPKAAEQAAVAGELAGKLLPA